MDRHDPLYPATAAFPLGRQFGLLPEAGDPPLINALPFGLRQAVVVPGTPIGDLASYAYDHEKQIGVMRHGYRVLPLLKHTTGQTNTVTHPDGSVPRDSDVDHRED